jgi:hypothetical protein
MCYWNGTLVDDGSVGSEGPGKQFTTLYSLMERQRTAMKTTNPACCKQLVASSFLFQVR